MRFSYPRPSVSQSVRLFAIALALPMVMSSASQKAVANPAAQGKAVESQSNTSAASETTPKSEEQVSVYDEWVQHHLKAERASILPPHKLTLSHPKHHIVVCEAGCPTQKEAEIVYMEPKDARGPVDGTNYIANPTGGKKIQAGATANVARKLRNDVNCVGGCYAGTTTIYNLAAGGAADSNDWLTAEQPATFSKPAVINKRWFKRMEDGTQ